MPKITNSQHAINFGESFANNLFNKMLDVENQDFNFSWNNFPQVFDPNCRAHLFSIYRHTPNNLSELEDIASIAYLRAGEILKKNYPRELPICSP